MGIHITRFEQWTRDRQREQDAVEVMQRATVGFAEEFGEVARLLKRALYRGESFSRDDLALELGDVLYNVLRLSNIAGVSLDEIARRTLEKYEARNR